MSKTKNRVICSVWEKCGACKYINKSYEEQLKIKQKWIDELLSGFGKVSEIIPMHEPYFYRHKVHVTFKEERNGKIVSGIYEENSHRIVSTRDCVIEHPKAREIALTIESMLSSFKIRPYHEDKRQGLLRHVLMRIGESSEEIMVVLVLASPIFPSKNNFIKALLKKHPEITTILMNINDKKTNMVLGEREQVLYGKGFIEDELCGMRFKISAKSFYQVNPVQTQILYNKALEMADLKGNELLLDAYCGTGTIGIIASKHVKDVIGVELNDDAIKDAIFNAKKNHAKNIRFYKGDAGEFLMAYAKEIQLQSNLRNTHNNNSKSKSKLTKDGKKERNGASLDEGYRKIDVLMMDPPRTGSSAAFLISVCELKPQKVVYISCNPETLARDLKLLTKDYKVQKILPVEMFPWTQHLETIVLLTKK